jgi:hypothetical protein
MSRDNVLSILRLQGGPAIYLPVGSERYIRVVSKFGGSGLPKLFYSNAQCRTMCPSVAHRAVLPPNKFR